MLTDKGLRALKPREKPYKRADEKGLYVIVRPDGAFWWRFKYRIGGREKLISLGTYPDISLSRAREKRDDARRALDRGLDPSVIKRAQRETRAETFKGIADEWLEKQPFAGATRQKSEWLLGLVASLNGRPIREVQPADLLRELRKIESRGKHETAHRARQLVSQVYRYAVATGRADRDITTDLRGALAPVPSENHAALTHPDDVAALLRAIDGYQGQPAVMYALKLAPLVFVRPGELRAAEWSEFDLEAKEPEWRIPAERMKMGERHIVPLSTQALALLRELAPHTGRGRYLFPSLRTAERCISENTLNAALRRLGYGKDEQTGHGFRTIASTLLNELGFHPDVIELQLAHKPRDKVRAAYNKAERLAERRKMMQAWADYLDGLKADTGAKVTAIGAR
jgi:integrase